MRDSAKFPKMMIPILRQQFREIFNELVAIVILKVFKNSV